MRTTVIITTMVMLLFGNVAILSAEEQEASENSYDRYKVIFERNIFSKDRLPPQTQNGTRRVSIRQVLSIYVLRGIAAQKDQNVAFIEEQISGQTMKAQIGTEVLDGKITEIKYDRVAFEQDGQTKYIRIGGEFGKTETTVETTESEEASQAAPAEQPAAGGTTGDENDILKKLMERRKSELGQ